jgi:hypothetical protein
MQPEIDQDLERVIHQELRKLPPVKAPEMLSVRVLATVRAQAALPWWQRSIWHWPSAVRTAFLIVLAVIVAAITSSTWWAGDVVARGAGVFTESTQPLMTLGNAFVLVWKTFLHNIALFALAFSGMLYLLCVGAGTMFVRLAVRRS